MRSCRTGPAQMSVGGEPSPRADVGGGEPSSRADVGGGEPSSRADVGGGGPSPRRRCERGGPSLSVWAGVRPVLGTAHMRVSRVASAGLRSTALTICRPQQCQSLPTGTHSMVHTLCAQRQRRTLHRCTRCIVATGAFSFVRSAKAERCIVAIGALWQPVHCCNRCIVATGALLQPVHCGCRLLHALWTFDHSMPTAGRMHCCLEHYNAACNTRMPHATTQPCANATMHDAASDACNSRACAMGVTPVPPASISTCLHAIARSPTPNVPAVYAIRPVGPGRPQPSRVGGVPHSLQVRRAGGQQQLSVRPDAARVLR